MAQQVFAEVEVDRCLYCHGLWFDAGELDTMSTRASEAAARGACDACGVASEEGHLASTGFGRLCRTCMEGVDLARSAPPPEPWSGLRRGELSAQWSPDPGGGETLFEFLGIEPDDFIDALRTRPTDAAVWTWVEANMQPRTHDEIRAWNRMMMTRTPDTPEAKARFQKRLEDLGQSHRTDLTRQFDRFDLDEDRDVPIGSRR